MEIRFKAGLPLGGTFRAERNFSLSCDFSGGTNQKRQRETPLRAENSAYSGKRPLYMGLILVPSVYIVNDSAYCVHIVVYTVYIF
jgi:hypothetical protein